MENLHADNKQNYRLVMKYERCMEKNPKLAILKQRYSNQIFKIVDTDDQNE